MPARFHKGASSKTTLLNTVTLKAGTHLFRTFIRYPWIGTQLHSERNHIVGHHVAHLQLHSITAILNTVSGCN